jgi:hypothetical protein
MIKPQRIADILKMVFSALFLLAMLWVSYASIVFRYRHPWVTDMEMMMRLDDVLMMRDLDYSDFRSDYE